MTDLLSWFGSSFATFVLAGVTAVLAYVTYTLKKATDHLARATILPRLVLDDLMYYSDAKGNPLKIRINNKGLHTAFNTHAVLVNPAGGRFPLDEMWRGDKDIPASEGADIFIQGMVHEWRYKLVVTYQDADDYGYTRTFEFNPPVYQSGATTKGGTAS